MESDPLYSILTDQHAHTASTSLNTYLSKKCPTRESSVVSGFQICTGELLEFPVNLHDDLDEANGSLHDLNSSLISPNDKGVRNILSMMGSTGKLNGKKAKSDCVKSRQISGLSFMSRGMPGSYMIGHEECIDVLPTLDLNSKSKRTSATDDTKRDFVIKLAKSLSLYGAPTHRLDFHLAGISEALGISSSFYILPGLILISYGNEDHASSTHLVQIANGYHMGQLSEVNFLCHQICDQKMHIDDATLALDKIRSRAQPDGLLGHPFFNSSLCYFIMFPLHSFLLCLIGFRGKLFEALMAGVISIVVAGFVLLSERIPNFLFVLDFLSAFAVCILARIVQWVVSNESGFNLVYGNGNCFNYVTVSISAIALLLPGLSLTFSVVEISSKNIISGTTRLLGAAFTAVMLGYGMSHGTSIVTWNRLPVLGGTASACEIAPNPLWVILLFPALSANIDYFFKANLRQFPIMLLTCIVGYGTSSLFYTYLPAAGDQIPVSTAALLVGLVSNTYSRITNDIAIAPILSGILLLVPGSMGVRSSLLILGNNIGSGTSVAFQMVSIAMSITVGLFLSSLIVWPTRRKNRFEAV